MALQAELAPPEVQPLPELPDPKPPRRLGRIRGGMANFSRFELVVALLIALLLLGLVVFPAVTMIISSVRPSGLLPLSGGPFTLSSLRDVASQLVGGRVLLDTAIYSFGSLALAMCLALPFAYLTERTDLPGRNFFYLLMFLPLSIPAFAFALSWVLLLNPQAGMVNAGLRHLFGLSPISFGPLSIYSLPGLIWVQGIGIVPSVWLILVSVLRNFNRTHEDAARLCGAGLLGTFRRVTVPLMRPGIGAVIVLFLLAGFYGLDVAIAIAPAAHIPLLPIKIYFAILPNNGTQLPDYAAAAGFGVFGMAIGLIFIAIYLRLIRRASSYATVSGKDFQPSVNRLGRWRWVAYGAFALYGLIAIVLPVGILAYASVLSFYTAPGVGTLHWTLSNYSFLKSYSGFWHFFVNTMIVATGAALASALLANLIAWFYVRRRSALSTTLNVLSFVPLAIPGTITSLAFFIAVVGTPLYESLIVMIVAYITGFLPFCVRLAHSAQVQIDPQLEEASRVGGAGSRVAFMRINLPLVGGAFVNSALWVFVHAAKDFSVGLILAGGSTALVANIVYANYEAGSLPTSAAMLMFMVVINMVIMFSIRKRLAGIGNLATAR